MWVLCDNERWPDKHFRLLCGHDLGVGRHQVIALGDDDRSISRSHAVLHSPLDSQPSLSLTDVSKYGTFVNGARLERGVSHALSSGDRVRFGLQWHEWTVRWRRWTVMASLLPRSQLSGCLSELLTELGLQLESSWDEQQQPLCVVMAEFRLSVKAALALASAVPLVTLSYLSALRDALRSDAAADDPPLREHLPVVTEPALDSQCDSECLLPRRERLSLFAGRCFVFAGGDRQMSRLQLTVKLAGGQSQLLADTALDRLTECGLVLVKGGQQLEAHVQKQLSCAGVRAVDEHEIGVSLVRCSTARECNPDRHCDGSLVSVSGVRSPTRPVTVLAPDTEAVCTEPATDDEQVISETPDKTEPNLSKRRRLSNHSDGIHEERSATTSDVIEQRKDWKVGRQSLHGTNNVSNCSTKRRRVETDGIFVSTPDPPCVKQRAVAGSTVVPRSETESDMMDLFDAEELILDDSQLDEGITETGNRQQVSNPLANVSLSNRSEVSGARVEPEADLSERLNQSESMSWPREKGYGDRAVAAGNQGSDRGQNNTTLLPPTDRLTATVIGSTKIGNDGRLEATDFIARSVTEKQQHSASRPSPDGRNQPGSLPFSGRQKHSNFCLSPEREKHSGSRATVSDIGGSRLRSAVPDGSRHGGAVTDSSGLGAAVCYDSRLGGAVTEHCSPDAVSDGWLHRMAGVKLEPGAGDEDQDSPGARGSVVVVTDLLRVPVIPDRTDRSESGCKNNFKRFRAKATAPSMVRIIGGADLYVHSRVASVGCEPLRLNDGQEEEETSDGFEQFLNPIRPTKRHR